MDNRENEKSLAFTKDDFFNAQEMKQFVSYLSNVSDVDTYMKRAIINRVMMDAQSDVPHYETLIQHVQNKGIESIIQLIEKREQSATIDEEAVERIVLRVLREQKTASFSTLSVIREEEVETHAAKTQETPIGERKKPSSKLNKL